MKCPFLLFWDDTKIVFIIFRTYVFAHCHSREGGNLDEVSISLFLEQTYCKQINRSSEKLSKVIL